MCTEPAHPLTAQTSHYAFTDTKHLVSSGTHWSNPTVSRTHL